MARSTAGWKAQGAVLSGETVKRAERRDFVLIGENEREVEIPGMAEGRYGLVYVGRVKLIFQGVDEPTTAMGFVLVEVLELAQESQDVENDC